ncbi:hypothetical protein [Aquidulcibacter sp.]|uniref:hypothetical protein n=1 Tax=Aquidulcibacter sp. TaxID=2052990 RepID=UPI0025C1CE7E|nr:hypothetical protein [Aquidulcibacter sp.]MCA3694637.1 hypothetical protein [Aquidulcibacter sp.]
MNGFIDFEWIAAQAGVPVSFLIGIPIFFAIILTLASMMGSKEPENYRIGRHAEAKRGASWLAPVGLVVLIGVALTNYGHFFVPH